MANTPITTATTSLAYPKPLVPRTGSTPGLYQVCTNANTDYPVAIPTNARALKLWFENSTADTTQVYGRVAFDASNTAIATLTGTDALMGYQDDAPAVYVIPNDATYVHVANVTAGAVARGMFYFE